jgi:hypothetical protein
MKQMAIQIQMANGDAWEVRTTMGDFVAYDDTGKRQRPPWGAMADNVARWEAFLAWHASRRLGLYDKPWETFLDDCVLADGQAVDLDPTVKAPGVDGSLS